MLFHGQVIETQKKYTNIDLSTHEGQILLLIHLTSQSHLFRESFRNWPRNPKLSMLDMPFGSVLITETRLKRKGCPKMGNG